MTLMVIQGCPDCGASLEVHVADEVALFHHGGYGETRRTVRRWCPCGWSLTAMVGATR